MHILTPAPLIHSLLLSYITKFTTVTKPLQCYLFRLCTQSGRLFHCEVLPCTCLNVDACSFVVVILVMYQSIYISFLCAQKAYTYFEKKVHLSTVPEEDIFCLHHIIFWSCSACLCFETVIAQGIFYYICRYPTKHTICESIMLLSFLFFEMSNCIWDKENSKNVH